MPVVITLQLAGRTHVTGLSIVWKYGGATRDELSLSSNGPDWVVVHKARDPVTLGVNL